MKKNFLTFIILILAFYSIGFAQQKSVIKDGAKLELIADDFKFTEGPAVNEMGDVYFTDQPNNRILKWNAETDSISVFCENAGRSNGLFFDREGNLWSCADENFELWKISPEKEVTVLLDNFKGKKLNGPNDLWIDDRGGIYFTDPYYQRDYWERQAPEMESKRVYYLSPDHQDLKIVAEGFVKPNGIIGSSKKGILYIADIGKGKTYSYKIAKDGKLKNKKLFAEMGSDGMTMDNEGNVYLTGNGVTIFDKKGHKIEHINIDRDWTANITFGGENQDILFITASEAVYTLQMNTHGTSR